MLAGESSLSRLCWWLWLGEQCTRADVGFPRMDLRAKFVRCGCFGDEKESAARGGRGGVPTCACSGTRAPFKPLCIQVVATRAPHCVQQKSKSTMVCGGGGGATVLADTDLKNPVELVGWGSWVEHCWRVRAWSRGCARMRARRIPAMCRACISEGVPAPFPPPSPLPVGLTHFLFEPAPRTRTPALLPPPLPLSLCLSSSVSPSVTPSTSLSPTWCWQGADKVAPTRHQATNKASVQTQGIGT